MGYRIEDFLQIKVAMPSSFSPDGETVLVHADHSGSMQLYTVPVPGGPLRQITDDDEPVQGSYLPTSREVLLLRDAGGNERTQIYRMNDDGSARRPVVVDPDYLHVPGAITRDGASMAYQTNRRNGADFDVVVHSLVDGSERTVFDMGGWCSPVGFSPDGRVLVVAHYTDRNADNDLYLVDLATGAITHLTPHDEEAMFGRPAWLPDSSAFFFATDAEREFSSIAHYDLGEAAWEFVIEDEWDLSPSIDWRGTRLLVSANADGYTRIRAHDPSTFAMLEELPLPRAGGLAATLTQDGTTMAFGAVSSVEPGDVYRYDFDGGRITRLTTSPNPVDRSIFVEPTLHHISSFDGERIPVFLYRPRVPIHERAPVLVVLHGGPEGQHRPTFSAVIQYLVYRGYAVAAPNVRGSVGYGKRFHHLDDVDKRLDSVRDLEAIHAWIGQTPGLDPTRAALWGGSYGGYMVLAGLAFQPTLWAAGVDIVGISNLVTFLENTSAYRRRMREREYGRLDRDREMLERASPINRVDDIRAPLFLIHGRNDPRVPVGEAEQIRAALARKGIATELLIYDDEGHGLSKLKNRLDAYPKAVDFLDRVLLRSASSKAE